MLLRCFYALGIDQDVENATGGFPIIHEEVNNEIIPNVGWYYLNPLKEYDALRDHIAFYPSKLDECLVNDEKVEAQEGDFYGGWITRNIKGPFKGGPGTFGW